MILLMKNQETIYSNHFLNYKTLNKIPLCFISLSTLHQDYTYFTLHG